jgi:hypothetical protein
MAQAVKVRVVVEELRLNDPNHQAFTCRYGDVVTVAGGWYAESLVASKLVEFDNPKQAELIVSLGETEALLSELRAAEAALASASEDNQPEEPAETEEPTENMPVEAPQQPQETESPPKPIGLGSPLPGRVSEAEVIRKRAGSKRR